MIDLRFRRDWLPTLAAVGLAAGFALLFSWLAVSRHQAFQSHAFDLGNVDQAVWNTLHGRLLRFTDMTVAGNRVLTSRLAIHVEPLLIPISVLYLIHSGPETLLVLQAVVVGTGALPAFLLARDALAWRWSALIFPLAYLLHPSLQNAVLDDFHAVTLSAAFLLWAMLALYRRQRLVFAACAVLAASTKEEISLLLALLGLVWILRGAPRFGALLAAMSVVWFFLCVGVIIPHANPHHSSPYLARYSYLGHGLLGVVGGAALHPLRLLSVLTSPDRLQYLSNLLAPLGYVSLAAFPVLLLAAPTLAINLLSADPSMYSGYYQYSAELIPYVVVAALLAIALVAHRGRVVAAVLAALVLAASVLSAWQYGFMPLANGYLIPHPGSHQELENHLLHAIPPQAVVAAADEIEPHLSDRPTIYLLPTTHPINGPAARYLVLDASIPSLPTTPATLHRVAERALRSGYGIVRAQDGILILGRGHGPTHLPSAFYSFLSHQPSRAQTEHIHWGPLALSAAVVHPRDGLLTRSRPALSLETVWRLRRQLPRSARISFYVSPVYTGRHPHFSARWQASNQSPSWIWLPLSRWPVGRAVTADSLPLVPDISSHGRVDVALGVRGLGDRVGGRGVTGAPRLVRLATLRVGY